MLPPLVPTKTATGTYDRTITWALDKSVTPDVLNGNAGESAGSVTWTVVATKSEVSGNYAVSGTISVYNPASIPQTFSVSDMLDDGTVASNLTCDMDTVPAGGTATCTYSAAPFSKAMSNTATVTAAGNLNQTATAEITWTENPIGEEAGTLIDERFDFAQLITGSLTQTFTESFECSSNPNDYTNGSYSYTETNTAILNDNTNLSESATVTVNCTLPPLVPTKDAAGTYDRTVTWDLTKTVTPANHSGYAGDKFSSTWTVIADKTEVVDGKTIYFWTIK